MKPAPNVTEAVSNAVRGAIIAPSGRKLVIVDLSNIEGRVAAWLAGEEWKLQAFRDFDTVIPGEFDAKGKPKRKGVDLYVRSYMGSFNVTDPLLVGKDERQIGKVCELMFQFGGGVGAWLTGAATYGIDLPQMTEQVWDTLPLWARAEAESFMHWLSDQAIGKLEAKAAKQNRQVDVAEAEAAKLGARFGLSEKVFIACDAIKRLWRSAHPAITTYWKEIEDAVRAAVEEPGTTFTARKLKVRRSGTWLRVRLPSGRELCYPSIKIDARGGITYAGVDQYTKTWGRIHTYGGKLFENFVQAVACDQFYEPLPVIEEAGYDAVLGVHDEWVCETPDNPQFTAERLAEMMCSDLGWNQGLPLAAAGFECKRYRKGD